MSSVHAVWSSLPVELQRIRLQDHDLACRLNYRSSRRSLPTPAARRASRAARRGRPARDSRLADAKCRSRRGCLPLVRRNASKGHPYQFREEVTVSKQSRQLNTPWG